MKKNFLAFAGALLVISQFAFATSPMLPQVEKVTVKNIELRGNFMPPLPRGGLTAPLAILTVHVDSNGCTDENSFVVQVSKVAQGQSLTIVRKAQDVCKAYLPDGVEVKLRAPMASFGDVFITNPLRVDDRTSH